MKELGGLTNMCRFFLPEEQLRCDLSFVTYVVMAHLVVAAAAHVTSHVMSPTLVLAPPSVEQRGLLVAPSTRRHSVLPPCENIGYLSIARVSLAETGEWGRKRVYKVLA